MRTGDVADRVHGFFLGNAVALCLKSNIKRLFVSNEIHN